MFDICLKKKYDLEEIKTCIGALETVHGGFSPLAKTIREELGQNNAINVKSFVRLMGWTVPLTDESPCINAVAAAEKLCDALFGYHDFSDTFPAEQIRQIRKQIRKMDDSLDAGTEQLLINYHKRKVV